jgi:hypothetical protein
MIQAQDLEIGSIFWFDDRQHRVTDIIKGPIVQIVTRRSSVLGDYEVEFMWPPEVEVATAPTGTSKQI